jgi:hypothetical protein
MTSNPPPHHGIYEMGKGRRKRNTIEVARSEPPRTDSDFENLGKSYLSLKSKS